MFEDSPGEMVDVSDEIASFCNEWKVAELSVFGSVLRDDFRTTSDIDILVLFKEDADWSLDDWIDMGEALAAILGREVDLVSKKGLRNPFRRHEILRTAEVIYRAA